MLSLGIHKGPLHSLKLALESTKLGGGLANRDIIALRSYGQEPIKGGSVVSTRLLLGRVHSSGMPQLGFLLNPGELSSVPRGGVLEVLPGRRVGLSVSGSLVFKRRIGMGLEVLVLCLCGLKFANESFCTHRGGVGSLLKLAYMRNIVLKCLKFGVHVLSLEVRKPWRRRRQRRCNNRRSLARSHMNIVEPRWRRHQRGNSLRRLAGSRVRPPRRQGRDNPFHARPRANLTTNNGGAV
jgi:hypothetical protein